MRNRFLHNNLKMKVWNKTNRRKVDISANNLKITVPNFRTSKTNNQAENLELQDEHLDFEPDDDLTGNDSEEEQNHFSNSYNNESFTESNSITEEFETFSTVSQKENSVHYPTNRNNDHISITTKTSTFEYSHRGDLLQYHTYPNRSEDSRKKEYLQVIPPLISEQVMIDSSSDSDTSSDSFEHDDMGEDTDEGNEYWESNENGAKENCEEQIDNKDILNHDDEYSETSVTYEEEDVAQKPFFCDKSLCTSGFNIIIKTNINSKKLVLQRDSWKKMRRHYKAIDKRWKLRPNPYHHVRLFLEDIGYVPLLYRLKDSINFNSSETMNVDSSSSMSSCDTFISKQSQKKKICEQIGKCESQISSFKVPLPPTKRPPTRPKRSDSVSSNETILSHIDDRSVQECREDDVISISASSISYLELEEEVKEEQFSDYQSLINDNESVTTSFSGGYWLSSKLQNTSPPSLVSLNFIPPQNSPSNSKALAMSSQSIPSLFTNIIKCPLLESETNIRKNSAVPPVGPNRINFMEVPRFFSGICYHHYFNGRCVKVNCTLPHFIKDSLFFNKCKDLESSEEVRSLFNYVTNFDRLFEDIYAVFLKAFGHFKMRIDLINCIHLFLKKENIAFKNAMETIIESLQNTGLTFLQTVENILFNIEFLQCPILTNTLLDILTTRSNIRDNWEVIKRICKGTQFIAPEFFERILCKLLIIEVPNNRDLSMDIYNTVVKKEITNLTLVEPRLLRAIKTTVELEEKSIDNFIDENLSIEREKYERSQHNDCETSPFDYDQNSLSDADDRLNYVAPSYSSRKSNCEKSNSPVSICTRRSSSDLDSVGNNSDVYSLQGVKNYQYVPQAVTKCRDSMSISSISCPTPNCSSSKVKTSQRYSPVENSVITHSTADITALATSDYYGYPDQPIIGKFKFNEGFIFDQSLHHLLPSSCHQVSMSESHIIELNKFILNGNGSGFLRILDLYKSPTTIQHFVTMCVADIKSCKHPCNQFLDLLENIGCIEPNFRTNNLLKGIFEVIAFNMLLVFERKCQYEDARRFVEVFNDWDSLISSKQFGLRKLTPMGRYILLAKLLTKSKAFYYAYEILQSPDLNLLDSPKNWPLFRIDNIDLESRNAVLVDFFKEAYKSNIEVVCDMFRKIFQFKNIYQFDAYSYFNPMLEHLINHEKSLLLKYFYSNIDIFYNKMERNIFRAFTIFMEGNLTLEHRLRLYEYGCKKGIYVQFTGREQTIVLRTNMPNNEIKLILQYYFKAMSRLAYYEVNHDLNIEIRLPDGIVDSPKILHRCIRSINELNMSVKEIVHDYFLLQVISPDKQINTMLQVPKDELRKIIRTI
ncbi:uncharacterized protein LOC130899648 isoform X1 [Diorhabda carinulata]|uniref:uncharacterized protein LOC130899648 isoform X1 n=1 Tax=Diorhabda carinulata TaxID=1163345 RepID=UPI0025A14AAE|nr:uncharacterized protein LOC130899648 isoform X1 [Diorhabda carinulata]